MSVSPIGAACLAMIVGIILLVTDVEQRVGWALFVVGLIVAAVLVVAGAINRPRT